MTDAELKAWHAENVERRERKAEAWPEPWTQWTSPQGNIYRIYGRHQRGVCEMTNASPGQRVADLTFIAAARSDPVEDRVDALLAEVFRLRKMEARLDAIFGKGIIAGDPSATDWQTLLSKMEELQARPAVCSGCDSQLRCPVCER